VFYLADLNVLQRQSEDSDPDRTPKASARELPPMDALLPPPGEDWPSAASAQTPALSMPSSSNTGTTAGVYGYSPDRVAHPPPTFPYPDCSPPGSYQFGFMSSAYPERGEMNSTLAPAASMPSFMPFGFDDAMAGSAQLIPEAFSFDPTSASLTMQSNCWPMQSDTGFQGMHQQFSNCAIQTEPGSSQMGALDPRFLDQSFAMPPFESMSAVPHYQAPTTAASHMQQPNFAEATQMFGMSFDYANAQDPLYFPQTFQPSVDADSMQYWASPATETDPFYNTWGQQQQYTGTS